VARVLSEVNTSMLRSSASGQGPLWTVLGDLVVNTNAPVGQYQDVEILMHETKQSDPRNLGKEDYARSRSATIYLCCTRAEPALSKNGLGGRGAVRFLS
jgi:hypothetical protein